MDVMLGALLGLLLGWGASRTHPSVDAGGLIGALAGFFGGLAGQAWLGPLFAPALQDQELAGIAAGGAVGGTLLAPLVGFAVVQWRGRARSERPEPRDSR